VVPSRNAAAKSTETRTSPQFDGLPGHLLRGASSDALLAKALAALGSLPPFSPVLNRVLASLAEDDVPFSRLADLIEKDAVVAGNVLQLVNSALYARRGTVNSVRHAISILGVAKLRNAVLAMSVTRMWHQVRTPASWSMARFNMHSAAVAMLSDHLAQHLPVAYPEGAFAAGLLHDVGRLLVAFGLPQEHEEIIAVHEHELAPFLECEYRILGFTHTDLSFAALEAWNLPVPIRVAVRDHHLAGTLDVSAPFPLSSVLTAANHYVNSMGVSMLPEPGSPRGNPVALEPLGLSPETQSAVIEEFRSEFEAMSPFFR
jgi:HD-like signal output (HDOD) protein